MEVILLEKINKLGALGDKVNVKSGYGRNFLFPQGKALPATKKNLEEFEKRRAELEKKATDELTLANARADELNELEIVITRRAGDEGRMFGSVSNNDVADALNNAGIRVAKKEIRMPEGAIRQLGEYDVNVHLHPEVDAHIKVIIQAE